MRKIKPEIQIATFLKHISHPTRVRILLAIGEDEACVCHLEAILVYRQAYISQHLMELRNADILETSRDGRYVYYHIADLQILVIIEQLANIIGIPTEILENLRNPEPLSNCCCPRCISNHMTSCQKKI